MNRHSKVFGMTILWGAICCNSALGQASRKPENGALTNPITISAVQNAASWIEGPIAPGELVVISGSGLGPVQIAAAIPGSDGRFSDQLAGTMVQINGTPAHIVYTWDTEVAAVVPDSVSGDTAEVAVSYQGQSSASFQVAVALTAPGVFTADATGRGHAATISQDGSIDKAAHWQGDVVTLFITGAGRMTPAMTPAFAIDAGQPLPIHLGPVEGVMQIDVPIPFGTDCDLPVAVQVGNASSQAGVTIAVDICI